MEKQVHRTSRSLKNKKKKINKAMIIMSVINFLCTIILTFFVVSLKMIPIKYIVIIVCILVMLDLLVMLLLKKKKRGFKILGYVISIILILINGAGTYYVATTNAFLNKSFNNASNTYTSTYYIVVKSTSKVSDVKELDGANIGYYKSTPNIDEALKELDNSIKVNTKEYENVTYNYNDLKRGSIDAAIVEKSIYEALIDSETGILKESDYKIIYKFDIEVKEETEDSNEEEFVDDGNSLNIYIGGVDFTEKNTDFNMVVTINKKTHKILLTSIPRDYYVTMKSSGMHELLGYVGYTGINNSRRTVADLLGVNIDYYMKVNTNSIVGLVNTLGGVQFCNNGAAFTTTHALVQGTYDDTTGEKLNVPSGCRTYNGIQILTIVRERKAFADGDRQRQKNCGQVMINVFKKMASAGTVANYSSVLNAVSNLYTTNLSRDVITEIANETINGASWSFEQQSVTGYDSSGYVHMGTVKDYVMRPNQNSINTASSNIKKIMSGK